MPSLRPEPTQTSGGRRVSAPRHSRSRLRRRRGALLLPSARLPAGGEAPAAPPKQPPVSPRVCSLLCPRPTTLQLPSPTRRPPKRTDAADPGAASCSTSRWQGRVIASRVVRGAHRTWFHHEKMGVLQIRLPPAHSGRGHSFHLARRVAFSARGFC